MKKVVNKLPDLRFPEFKGEYASRPISDSLSRVSDAVNVVPQKWYQEIGIRSHGKGIFHKVPVQGETLGNKRVFWIKPEMLIFNIVFAWEQAVAKTTTKEVGMIASHRFPMFEPRTGITDINYFLLLFLTKKGKYLLGLASPGGAGRNKTLGQKTFNELKVFCPLLPEQQKIAFFLSAVDKKIEQLTHKKELLEQYKNGVMQRLFSGKMRFSEFGSENKEVKLGSIAHFFLGLTYTPNYVQEGVPFLSVKNLKNGQLDFHNIKHISREEFDRSTSNAKPQKGDVIFGRVGTLGNPIVLQQHIEFCIFVSLGFLRVKKNLAHNMYVKHWMTSSFFKRQVETQVAGSSQKNLNAGWLKKFSIILPALSEQNKIANFLSSIDDKINFVQTQLTQTQNFKKGLLQKMFV